MHQKCVLLFYYFNTEGIILGFYFPFLFLLGCSGCGCLVAAPTPQKCETEGEYCWECCHAFSVFRM